jgi:hypothetical protein
MLYSSDLNTYDIEDFCANTLKNSATFEAFCITEIGAKLNFETDSPMNSFNDLPALPYCTVHGGVEDQDRLQAEWGHPYEIALVFGILDETSSTNKNPPFTIVNGIKKYTSTRNIEKVAKEALKQIQDKMRATGISGDYDISIISAKGIKTATGEASDMNYILSLSFNYLDDIQKGC